MTERTLKDGNTVEPQTARTYGMESYNQTISEQQEDFQSSQIKLISDISSDIKDFKKHMQSKVEHVLEISQNMKKIKEEINQSQLNQVSEIQLDSDVISSRICDIIVPKIQAILDGGEHNHHHIQAADESISKGTFLVHSEASPSNFYNSPSDRNLNDFNYNSNNALNVRSYGNLMEFKSMKNATQYHNLMQLVFKISSMFTNLLAEIIQDCPYYEEMRQEVIV